MTIDFCAFFPLFFLFPLLSFTLFLSSGLSLWIDGVFISTLFFLFSPSSTFLVPFSPCFFFSHVVFFLFTSLHSFSKSSFQQHSFFSLPSL
ncbi:hypothetical protein V8F33_007620 [Rhypophila sp. PSN 637]